MARDEFGHLEHRDLLLAIEDRLQLVIGIDLGLFLSILQAVLLDVCPELLGDLCARKRFVTDNFCQSCIRLDGFHEGCIGFTCWFFAHYFSYELQVMITRTVSIKGGNKNFYDAYSLLHAYRGVRQAIPSIKCIFSPIYHAISYTKSGQIARNTISFL